MSLLTQVFSELEWLNPDALSIPRQRILQAAKETSADQFPELANRVNQLVDQFADSAFKRNQKLVLDEYFQALQETTRRLGGQGPEREDSKGQTAEEKRSRASNAEGPGPEEPGTSLGDRLLPVHVEKAPQWLEIIAQSGIEEDMHRAMDACANRNEVVETPLEIAFQILFLVDAGQAFDWSLKQLDKNPAFEDADVIRDLLTVWNCQAEIPVSAGRLALDLTEKNLEQFFPGAALQVNRLVRFLGLQRVSGQTSARGRTWEYLASALASGSGPDREEKLEDWLDTAVEQLGRHTASFIAGASRVDDKSTPVNQRLMARRQVFTDVRAVNALHPAIIAGADVFLKRADGVHTLALAFLGIDRKHLQKWRQSLEEKAAEVVRKLFMEDLRNRRDSAETIRKFCLGDELLYVTLYMKLDLFSRQFGSLRDREETVQVLATNYASFCETDLLKDKITRHFRALSKLLHTDSLQRLVPPEEKSAIADFANLASALTRGSEARRYLEGRRALETSVEDMCATEMHFEQQLKVARGSLLRSLL